MGENVNMIKNLMIFVKELSGEFQKSMLVFGNTLGSLSQKIKNVTEKIDKIENKFNNITNNIGINFASKQNEFTKIIIENNTKHMMIEFQTNLKKEFHDTLATSKYKHCYYSSKYD